jgi:hypothetical protein
MDQFINHPLYKKHNIDSAMSSLWEFYKKRFLSLFIISLFMSFALQYASTMVDLKELQSITDPMLMLEKLKDFFGPILIISLINLLFTTVLQYYILYNPLDPDSNIFISVIKSLRYFIPYLIIMVLLAFAGSIAILLGFFVLIVGAFFALLYVMTLYLLVLPVMMVEGASIGTAITRTIKLAHRNFWANIGWVAVFIIIILVISVILSSIILLPFSGGFLKTILNPANANNIADFTSKPAFMILSAITGALTLPLMPIFACILYFNGVAGESQDQIVKQPDAEINKVRVEDLYAKPYSDDHPDNPDNKN